MQTTTQAQLSRIGLGELVYIKQTKSDLLWRMYAADGSEIAEFGARCIGVMVASDHDMQVASVH